MKHKLSRLPSKIETVRLIIRKYKSGDGKAFFDLLEINDNREYLKEHIDEATNIFSEHAAESRLKELSKNWNERERFVLGIWLKSSRQYIGQIWIEPHSWEVPSFELGWFLERTHQGKGIATEASKAAIEFIFNHLNAKKVIVITRDDNQKSYELAERLGFAKEEHLKEHVIKKDGSRVGLIYYGLFKG